MCISPIRIRHPTKPDEFIDVNCNHCLECAQKHVNSWAFRLSQEMKDKNCYFFTLTYADEHLPYKNVYDEFENKFVLLPSFDKEHVQKLIHSIRDELRRNKLKVKLKYFITSEFGDTTLRPHYHGLIFGFPFDLQQFRAILEKYWIHGFVSCDFGNQTRIYYTLKYIFKSKVLPPKGLHPLSDRNFLMCSKNLGINFLTPQMRKYLRGILDEKNSLSVHNLSGSLQLIPKYYRDKLFISEHDKLKLKALLWDNFDEYAKCPQSMEPGKWRLENYNLKLTKFRNNRNKEKM